MMVSWNGHAGEESVHELPRGTNVKDKQRRQSFCYCFIPAFDRVLF